MERYEVIEKEILGRIILFGIIIKKGTIYFNIRDNKCNFNTVGPINITGREKIQKKCDYLNRFDKAKRYKIFKNSNNNYVILQKTQLNGCIKYNGIKYNYYGADQKIHQTIEQAKEVLKKAIKQYEFEENSKILKPVEY